MFWTLGSAASFSKIMKYLILTLMVFFMLFQLFPGKQKPGKGWESSVGGVASWRFGVSFHPLCIWSSRIAEICWTTRPEQNAWECIWPASLEPWGWAECLLKNNFHVQLFPCYFASVNAPMIHLRAVLLQQFSQSPPMVSPAAFLRCWVLLLLPLESLFTYSGMRASTEQSCGRECRPHYFFSAMKVCCLVNDLQYNFIKNWSEFWDYCL